MLKWLPQSTGSWVGKDDESNDRVKRTRCPRPQLLNTGSIFTFIFLKLVTLRISYICAIYFDYIHAKACYTQSQKFLLSYFCSSIILLLWNMFMYVGIHMHAHTYKFTHIHTYRYSYTQIYTHAHTHIYTHAITYAHKHIPTFMSEVVYSHEDYKS